jgi:hypothetical protein
MSSHSVVVRPVRFTERLDQMRRFSRPWACKPEWSPSRWPSWRTG